MNIKFKDFFPRAKEEGTIMSRVDSKGGARASYGVLTLSAILLALLMTNCTPIRPYRCDFKSSPARSPALDPTRQTLRDKALERCAPSFEETEKYRLSVVEFDDIGNYWYRSQADEFIHKLLESAEQPQILVAFVHGWNHNGKQGNSNIALFRRSLEYIADLEMAMAEVSGRKPREVSGLFVGWRGAAYRQVGLSRLYNWTSYWKRKGVAHSVGRAGALTELLARAESVLNDSDRKRGQGRSRMIAIGHSFGGAVLFDAVSQLLMARSVDNGCKARLGDLVILVNPAFEASHIEAFRQRFTAGDCTGASQEPPSVAIFTARNDKATRYLLRVGQQVGTWWERHRPSRSPVWSEIDPDGKNQGERARKGVGHYEPYFTHRLERIVSLEVQSTAPPPDTECLSCLYRIQGLRRWTEASGIAELGNFNLVETDSGPTPFWIIPVDDRKVIDRHNHIFTTDFVGILASLIARVEVSPWEEGLTKTAPTGM